MKHQKRMFAKTTIALSVSAMCALASSTAAAQSASDKANADTATAAKPADATAAPAETGLQEVIITAERRSTSLQSLPMAVSAMTSEDLKTKAVITIADLQRFTPSLSVAETGLQRFINIRGVGQAASLPQVQNGISYHVDGVFTRNTLNEIPYYDLQRVEVLRGPQGTLSGQSSTGGAIFVVTQPPEFGDREGYIELGAGNYNRRTGEAAVNIPVSDTVAMRAAIYAESRDSYYTILRAPGAAFSTDPAFQPGNLARTAMRLSLRAKPTKDLEILVRGEMYTRRSDGNAYKPTPGDPVAVFNGISAASVAPADPFTIDYNTPSKADLDVKRANMEVKWNLTDTLQLRSLTSFLTARSDAFGDADGTGTLQTTGSGATLRELATSQTIELKGTSQEFNLITTGSGPLQGVAGLYYFDAENAPNALTNPIIKNSTQRAQIISKAVFGQGTYAVSDRLKVTAGLRVNSDKVLQSGGVNQLRAVANAPVNQVVPTEEDGTAVTGRFTIDYTLSPQHLLYTTAARGYKAGAYNTFGLPSFTPEYVWSYEAGLKSTFLGKRLRTQLTVFNSDYKDYQINAYDPANNAQYVQNAGNAKIYGVEFQAQARFGRVDVDASFSRIHSEFGDANNGGPIMLADTRYAIGNVNRGPINITGKQLPFAQDMTAAFGVQYRADVGNGILTPRVQYSYNGGQWATSVQKTFDYIPSRNTIDLRLTYEQDDWMLAAYVTNLSNKTYIVGKFNGNDYYGAPREAGVKLRYRF